MGITFATEPSDGLELVQETLQRIATDRDWKREVIGDVDVARSRLSEPFPIYNNSLENIRNSKVLPPVDAKPLGWRYLVVDRNRRVVASVDLRIDGDDTLHLSRIWRGPVLDALVAAVGFAEGLFASGTLATSDDYELRGLELPAVFFSGLWLQGVADRILPISADVSGIDLLSAYDESDIAAALAPIAAARLT
jgi:hypothetical protein